MGVGGVKVVSVFQSLFSGAVGLESRSLSVEEWAGGKK